MSKCCFFTPFTGKGGFPKDIGSRKTVGFCIQGDYGWAAIFPDNGDLIIQINSKRWKLKDKDVHVDYFHVYKKKRTQFRILQKEKTFDWRYSSWWSTRPDFIVEPMAASREEENAEEDIFGYIAMLKENDTVADNLMALWSNTARTRILLCPYCLGDISEKTIDCAYCGSDVRKDSRYEFTTQEFQDLDMLDCGNCHQKIPELAFRCRYCYKKS
jgi:hypothetical protein